MKKINLVLLLIISSFSFLIAQISEEERTMTQGMNNGLTIMIPNVKDDFVEKRWKKFMKSQKAKTKKIKKSEEWLSTRADILGIGGSKSTNVYAIFEQSGDDVSMTTWFDMGGAFLSSAEHPERFSSGEDFLNEFELYVYQEGVRIEIKKEENNMGKLDSELKKLKKTNTRLHRAIEKAKETIAKAEEDIEINLTEQEEMRVKIEAQQEVVEKTKRKMEVRDNN